jgi:hypothetical protein
MKLIENWRKAPKMLSVQAFLLIGGVQSIQLVLSAENLASSVLFFPDLTWNTVFNSTIVALTIFGVVGRVIHQSLNGDAGAA